MIVDSKKILDDFDYELCRKIDPTPNFEQTFFKWLPNKYLEQLLNLIQTEVFQPYFYFLRGLAYEFGIIREKNLEKARFLYSEGVRMKEPYSLYRLYYLHRDMNRNEQDCDYDEPLFYLIKAACYFDMDEDERFSFNPIASLKSLIENNVVSRVQITRIIHKNKLKIEEDCDYIENIFNYVFNSNENETQKQVLTNILKLAKGDHLESIYFLSRQLYLKDKNKDALVYLEKCLQKNLLKSFRIYSCILYQEKMFEKSLHFAKLGSEFSDCKCLDFFGNMLIDEITFKKVNYEESFECFIKQTLYGDILGLDNAVFVLMKIVCKLRKSDPSIFEKYSRILFELSESVYKNSNIMVKDNKRANFVLNFGEQYYFISQFYYKGIGVQKNLKKAISILLESEKDESIKSKRMINNLLSKIYRKENEFDKAKEYAIKYFEALEKIEEKSPKHYYFLGKFLFDSVYLPKNLGKASYYFDQGVKFRFEFSYVLDIFYFKKCLKMKELIQKEYELLIEEIKINKTDQTLCTICYMKPKEAVFVPCGHKCTCYDCGMKITDTINLCPLCKKPTTFLLSKVFD